MEHRAATEYADRERGKHGASPEGGGSTVYAQRICARCEVRVECREYAVRTGQIFGVWGALSTRPSAGRVQRSCRMTITVVRAIPTARLSRHPSNIREQLGNVTQLALSLGSQLPGRPASHGCRA